MFLTRDSIFCNSHSSILQVFFQVFYFFSFISYFSYCPQACAPTFFPSAHIFPWPCPFVVIYSFISYALWLVHLPCFFWSPFICHYTYIASFASNSQFVCGVKPFWLGLCKNMEHTFKLLFQGVSLLFLHRSIPQTVHYTNLWSRWISDPLKEELTKFGYNPKRKIIFFRTSLYFVGIQNLMV
jgi:hypothetical protein